MAVTTRLALLAFSTAGILGDFLLAAGNWTHSTNLFSELHFTAGYNEAGQWDIITGGNWSPTDHMDMNLLGEAAAYLCPCPSPPCVGEEGRPKLGYNSSVFTCVARENRSALSYVVCTVFHADRSNVTCITPRHAISCDVPPFDPSVPISNWWQNNLLPSRSFYNDEVSGVSCIVRDTTQQNVAAYANFTDGQVLQEAIEREKCTVECRQVCQTVCVNEHRSVHGLFETLKRYEYDHEVDEQIRRFTVDGRLVEERRPTQWLRGVSPETLGERRTVLQNRTCTMPTLTESLASRLDGSLYDMLGRRINPSNVFDLTLYVALHQLSDLEDSDCVLPFPKPDPNAAGNAFDGRSQLLICHVPKLYSSNTTLGDADALSFSRSRRQLAAVGEARAVPEAAAAAGGGSAAVGSARGGEGRAESAEAAESMRPIDWDEWGPDGGHWDWHHALAQRNSRGESSRATLWKSRGRSSPRRQLLYHEFELEVHPYDYWLDEPAEQRRLRLEREAMVASSSCRLYNNCKAAEAPPLLLLSFECWELQRPNVTWIEPLLAKQPWLRPIEPDEPYTLVDVLCVQPSWPDATSVFCLTPHTAISCPYTDLYRGDPEEIAAANGTYYDLTTSRCESWPLRGALDAVAPILLGGSNTYEEAVGGVEGRIDGEMEEESSASAGLSSELMPWDLACDSHHSVATGIHHYCSLDAPGFAACNGHDEMGQASGVPEGSRQSGARSLSLATPVDGGLVGMCAGLAHTCAIKLLTVDPVGTNSTPPPTDANGYARELVCWGNVTHISVESINLKLSQGAPIERLECGMHFVCAISPVRSEGETSDEVPLEQAACSGQYHTRSTYFDENDELVAGDEIVLEQLSWPDHTKLWAHWGVGYDFGCGLTRLGTVSCSGNEPKREPAEQLLLFESLHVDGRHWCGVRSTLQANVICFSGDSIEKRSYTSWLTEWLVGLVPWRNLRALSIADTVGCAIDASGALSCVDGQEVVADAQLQPPPLLTPPAPLQPDRIDLVERGMVFSTLECSGEGATADGDEKLLGTQYCCGVTAGRQRYRTIQCWGAPPPNAAHADAVRDVAATDLAAADVAAADVAAADVAVADVAVVVVRHIQNRVCVREAEYLRYFGLRLLLDVHPNVSLGDATANVTQPYVCEQVPRRWTPNITDTITEWLGVNSGENATAWNASMIRSWQTTMLLTLHVAAYVDGGISCFRFGTIAPGLNCGEMFRYVNETVEVVQEVTKPFTIQHVSATDVTATAYTLAHTLQRDAYCFEKLRLTPSQQHRRGAAWHQRTQRVVDGFETLFTIQITNEARLCKSVRALVSKTLLYERCAYTGSDGLALVLRGGGAPAALGRGGGSLGYGGLSQALAIEFDSWANTELGDIHYNHVSVQTGGPLGAVEAHEGHSLATAALPPEVYPKGLADGKAHLVRVRYTPGVQLERLSGAPVASAAHLQYWVEEGVLSGAPFPHAKAMGTWVRPRAGTLEVFVDQQDVPLIALPIDIGHTLGLEQGGAASGGLGGQAALEPGRAWVGFTAATGRRFQSQYVLSWQFCEGPNGCVPPMSPCHAFGCNPDYPSPRYVWPHQGEANQAEAHQGGDAHHGDDAQRGVGKFDDLLSGVLPRRRPELTLSSGRVWEESARGRYTMPDASLAADAALQAEFEASDDGGPHRTEYVGVQQILEPVGEEITQQEMSRMYRFLG